MTSINDVKNDPKYIPCLDYGFVGLIDHMGSDGDIVRAARTSYGAGTRPVSEDRGLIRYLVRARHTSPIEMAEVKFHIKLPIFVMRQLVRHRTASLNEYSGRYSVMSDEFYLPSGSDIMTQSVDNKQGRGEELSGGEKTTVLLRMEGAYHECYDTYKKLLGDETNPGIARELARTVLPVANYTELYWKQDLHNLLHLIKLRRDPHAQKEIRVFAEAMYQHIQPLFPATCEAWEDYVWEGVNLSRMEASILRTIVEEWKASGGIVADAHLKTMGLGIREAKEFKVAWGL